jgi:hypothetical protein
MSNIDKVPIQILYFYPTQQKIQTEATEEENPAIIKILHQKKYILQYLQEASDGGQRRL